MNRFIDEEYPMAEREAAGVELHLPAWQVPLWDGIHFWAAGLGRDLMKKHLAALGKRWRMVPGQAEAVVLVERVVEIAEKKAAAAESARIRRELLEEFGEPGPVEWRHLMKALDRIIIEPIDD